MMDSSFEYYEVSFCVFFYGFGLKSILSDMSIAIPLFCICLYGMLFSNPLLLVCVGLLFWGESLVGSIFLVSHFLFHSATYCLLAGAFNPFTFKVIIDMYVFVAISPLCTCAPLSLTLFLPFLKAVSLAYFSSPLFLLGSPYFAFHFTWELCWVE